MGTTGSYAKDGNISRGDKLLGTDVSTAKTKNYDVGEIKDYIYAYISEGQNVTLSFDGEVLTIHATGDLSNLESNIVIENDYTSIGISADASQSDVNDAIDTLIGSMSTSISNNTSGISLNTADISSLDLRVTSIEENQYTGVAVYQTYALMIAEPSPQQNVSYKVANDPTPANNGYYSYNGSTWDKDSSLILGEIESGNVDAVTGGKIYDVTVKKIENENLFPEWGAISPYDAAPTPDESKKYRFSENGVCSFLTVEPKFVKENDWLIVIKDGTTYTYSYKKNLRQFDDLSNRIQTINIFDRDEIRYGYYITINISDEIVYNSGSPTWNITRVIDAEPEAVYNFKCYDFVDYPTGYRVIVYCIDENDVYLGQAATTTSTAPSFSANKCKVFTTLADTAKIIIQYYRTLDDHKEIGFFLESDYDISYTPPFTSPWDEPQTIYQNTTTVNYNSDLTYEWLYANSIRRGDYDLSRIANTSKSYAQLAANEFNVFQVGDTHGHDSTLCLHYASTKLYCVYTANQVTSGDSATDVNAFVRLQILQATPAGAITSLLDTITIAKNGDIISGIQIASGAGVPNAYMVNDTLYILFTAQGTDGIWYEFMTTCDCLTDTLSTPVVCQIDGGNMSCQAIATHIGVTTNNMINMNASIAEFNGAYYATACSYNYFPNGAVLKTTDFLTWEFVFEPDFGSLTSSGNYEGALGALDGYLYLALRQDDLDTAWDINPIILAKYDTNHDLAEAVVLPSGTSRACFFLRGTTELFLAYPTDNRRNTAVMKIGSSNLRDSYLAQDIATGGNYTHVCPRSLNLQFISRTAGTTGIRISSMPGLSESSTDAMTDFNTAMGY